MTHNLTSGIALIKSFEGLSLNPYHGQDDAPGLFTIGYGTTVYPDGKHVQLTDASITESTALELLSFWVNQKAYAISPFLPVDLSDNQFGALVSFAYNVGEGALRSSTLLKRVIANKIDTSIRDAFMMWIHGEGGNVIPGLVRRRKAESDLYFTV